MLTTVRGAEWSRARRTQRPALETRPAARVRPVGSLTGLPLLGVTPGLELVCVQPADLQRAPQTLSRRIVATVAIPAHPTLHNGTLKSANLARRALTSSIG